MTTTPDLAVPMGFDLLNKPSPFLTMLGPVYARGMGPTMVMGFHVQHHHLNRRGILHGGVVASLADAALGYCLAEPGEGTGGALAMSTASLTVDFIASAGKATGSRSPRRGCAQAASWPLRRPSSIAATG